MYTWALPKTILNDDDYFNEWVTESMDNIININKVFGRGVQFIQGNLVEVLSSSQILIKLTHDSEDDVDMELLQEKVIEFDYLALCTGAQYWLNEKDSTYFHSIVTKQQRLNLLRTYRDGIDRAKAILVVGGGPTGVEFLSEIIDKYGKTKEYGIMDSKDTLLNQFPESAQRKVTRYFEKNLVSIHANSKFELKRAISTAYDFVLMWVGTKCNSDFFNNNSFSDWKDETGRIFCK